MSVRSVILLLGKLALILGVGGVLGCASVQNEKELKHYPHGPCPDLTGKYKVMGSLASSYDGIPTGIQKMSVLYAFYGLWGNEDFLTVFNGVVASVLKSGDNRPVAANRWDGRVYEPWLDGSYFYFKRKSDREYQIIYYLPNGRSVGGYAVPMLDENTVCYSGMYYNEKVSPVSSFAGDGSFSRHYGTTSSK